MAAKDDKEVITKETMNAYAEMLEKSTQQMSTIVSHLEHLDERFERVEDYVLNSGTKLAVIENSNERADEIKEVVRNILSEVGGKTSTIKDLIATLTANHKEQNAQLAANHKEQGQKLSSDFDLKLVNINSSLKISQITNIVGWIALIGTILTKIFGKG